jgi:cyanophycinase-like exopeptidase
MKGFNWIPFYFDTHFHARGRFGRIAPMMVDLKVQFGFGLDENTTMFIDNSIGYVYGQNGVTFVDLS